MSRNEQRILIHKGSGNRLAKDVIIEVPALAHRLACSAWLPLLSTSARRSG